MTQFQKLRDIVERKIPFTQTNLTALLLVHDKETGITHISLGGQAPKREVLKIVTKMFEGFVKLENGISEAALEGIYNGLHDETDPVFEINNN